MFLTILRHHVREGHLQYLIQLRADMHAEDHEETYEYFSNSHDSMEAKSAANDSLPCELGLRYPLLQSIMARGRNHQTLQVTTYDIVYIIAPNIVYDIINDIVLIVAFQARHG